MKRLIDANALFAALDVMASDAILNDVKICIGDIRELILIQPTIIFTSDDFTHCNKVLSCKDIMCGGECDA